MAARKNPYRGILQPRQVGVGAPEVSVVVIYDVEDDKVRNQIGDLCLNYGLERIQYSAFFGRINRNRRQELALRIRDVVGDEVARVRIIPVTEDALRDMWNLDQYRKAAVDEARPKLRIVGGSDD